MPGAISPVERMFSASRHLCTDQPFIPQSRYRRYAVDVHEVIDQGRRFLDFNKTFTIGLFLVSMFRFCKT